jgi:phage gpG-like protein
MIEAKIEYKPVLDALRRAASQMGNTAPLMADMAGIMHKSSMRNFEEQGRPKWKDLASSTKLSQAMGGQWKAARAGGSVQLRKPGMILSATGLLKNSIQMSSSGTQAVVGTNLVYAAIHQFGGRTKPHVIRPKYKRALAFGGIVVRSVNHPGSSIPARPFLRLTPGDLREIVLTANNFYQRNLPK